MKAQLQIPLGNKKLTIEGEGDSQNIVKALGFWAQIPTTCGACKSDNIGLSYKSPGDYDYYGLRCADCTAELNFGQKRDGSGFFISADSKWEIWDGNKEKKPAKQEPSGDIPF